MDRINLSINGQHIELPSTGGRVTLTQRNRQASGHSSTSLLDVGQRAYTLPTDIRQSRATMPRQHMRPRIDPEFTHPNPFMPRRPDLPSYAPTFSAEPFSALPYQPMPSARPYQPMPPFAANPYLPLPPMQSLPPQISPRPYTRPSERLAFFANETATLRRAGFRSPDRERLAGMSMTQAVFVIDNAEWFKQLGFTPHDMMNAARLSRWDRDFLLREANCLYAAEVSPAQMNDLASMPSSTRDFVLRYHSTLRDSGFSVTDMMSLATRPTAQRHYILHSGPALYAQGWSIRQMMQEARNPRPVEVQTIARPPVSRASTSTLPRPRSIAHSTAAHSHNRAREPFVERTAVREHAVNSRNAHTSRVTRTPRPVLPMTDAEVAGFFDMGLEPEVLVQLAERSDTERAFVLAQGQHLLDSGLALDEILQLARASDSNTRPAPARADSPGPLRAAATFPSAGSSSHRRDQSPVPFAQRRAATDIDDLVSYLTDADIDADRLARETSFAPQRTQSPTSISLPRNAGPLPAEVVATLDHAYNRWARNTMTRADGERFFRDVVSSQLCNLLCCTEPGYDDRPREVYGSLRLLLTGVAYMEDNQRVTTAPRHLQRIKTAADYLSTHLDDLVLLHDCENVAGRAVGHCGDGVAYGMTQVEQAIQLRRVSNNELSPRDLFRSIEQLFLQRGVEGLAAQFANERLHGGNNSGVNLNQATESVELYMSLSQRLLERGMNLTESAQSSTYGEMWRATDEDVARAERQLYRHTRDFSTEYLQEFKGNTAVEGILRRLFTDSFQTMVDEREAFSDEANDVLLDEHSDAEAQNMAGQALEAMGAMEKDWYAEKLNVVLRDPSLLNELPA